MTNEERKVIGDTLRNRITEITKLFHDPAARVREQDVQQAMKVQILCLARDLDTAFYSEDTALAASFVDAVRFEMNSTIEPKAPVLGYASAKNPRG